MAVKKISELDTKSFLGSAGAAANSYVLINYEDNTTSEPVTYKATIDELGKAIANNLHLYKKTQDGAVTTDVSLGAYVDGTAQAFITSSALNGLASVGAVNNIISNTPEIARIIGSNNPKLYYQPNMSATAIPITTEMISGAANYIRDTMVDSTFIKYNSNIGRLSYESSPATIVTADLISGAASIGYVTNAISNAGGGGFNPTTSVPCLGMYAPEGSDAETENLYPAMAYGQMICTPDSDARYFSPLPLLYYEKDGTDLKLKDEFNNTLCTLTGVISNS